MINLQEAQELKENYNHYANLLKTEKEKSERARFNYSKNLIVSVIKTLKEKIESEGCGNTFQGYSFIQPHLDKPYGRDLLLGKKEICPDCQEAQKVCEEILKSTKSQNTNGGKK